MEFETCSALVGSIYKAVRKTTRGKERQGNKDKKVWYDKIEVACRESIYVPKLSTGYIQVPVRGSSLTPNLRQFHTSGSASRDILIGQGCF